MSNKNKKTDTFLKYLYKMSVGGVVGDPINPKTLDAADSAKNFLSKMIESPLFKERYAATKGKKIENVSVEELTDYKNKVTDNINTAKHGDVFENGNDFANRSYRGWYDPTKTREEQETIKLGKQQFINNLGGIDKVNKVLDAESSIYKVSDKIPYSIGNIAYPMFSNVRSKYESFNIPENHKVYTQNNEYLPGIIDHEYSHASTRGNEDLNYKGVPFLMNEDVLNKPENSDYKNQKGYFQDPTEQKARVDATRKWMSENKSYNPFNERFDESHYNILKSKIDSNGEGIDHDLFKQMKDLILPYDKEETIRMFNTYTNVDNKNLGIQTAAFGGIIQNNMRKKMGLGGFAPLFDIASNLLLDGTMQAVTGMVKSIKEPEPESRMTKMNTGMVMAKGGQVPNVPVEVEGGEVFETPDGQQGKFQGPSHTQGGVTPVVNGKEGLPQGTMVFSKQVKGENGKTMADRKEIRERNVAKLERLISKNPHDKLLKETLKRQQQVANSEEQGDMAMQEQANQQQQMQEQQMMQQQMMGQMMQNPEMMMALGGYVQKLANGSPGTCPPGQYWNGTECVEVPNSFKNSFEGNYVEKVDGNWKWKGNDLDPNAPMDAGQIAEFNKHLSEPGYFADRDISEVQYYEGLSRMQPLMNLMSPSKNNTLPPDINNFDYGKGAVNKGLSTLGNKMKGFKPNVNPNVNNNLPLPPTYTEGQSKLNVPNLNVPVGNMGTQQPIVTDNNTPFFLEEQLNQLGTPQFNPLDARKNQGVNNIAPTVNPNVYPKGMQLVEESKSLPIERYGDQDFTLMENIQDNQSVTGTNPYDVMTNGLGKIFQNISQSKDPYINTKNGMIPNPLYNEVIGNKMLKEEDPKKPNKIMNFLNKAVDKTGDFFTGLFDKNGKPKKEKINNNNVNSSGDLTRGDIMGMAGTFLGGTAPMMNTMVNRMMTPNELNHYREFGAEGLRAMQEAQGLATINRDKQLADIKLREEAGRQRGRNSARGINTLRAGDIDSDMVANQAQNQAYAQFAGQQLGLLGQKAQQANLIDSTKMAGEEKKVENTQRNLDNYYSQLGTDFTTQSEALQNQGKNLNQEHYNQMVLNILPMLSRYGIGIKGDGKGGWEQYDVNPVKPEVAEVVQKPEEIKTIPTPKKALGGVVKKSNNKFTNKFNHIMNRK